MSIKILTSLLARTIADEVRITAKRTTVTDDNNPIAVTVIGTDAKTIITLAMDDVMPISVDLSYKKAYTALVTKIDTLEWEKRGTDPSNFADPNITCFGGGILLKSDGKIYGAIGVSGRRSHQEDEKESLQDHELAEKGANFFEHLAKERKELIREDLKKGQREISEIL